MEMFALKIIRLKGFKLLPSETKNGVQHISTLGIEGSVISRNQKFIHRRKIAPGPQHSLKLFEISKINP